MLYQIISKHRERFKSHQTKIFHTRMVCDKRIIYKNIYKYREFAVLITISSCVQKHDVLDLDCTIVAETLTDYDKICD